MGKVYYNEFDPAAAAWLRELMANNLIAQGDVDERSIKDVRGDELRGYTQCHFFAGIGIWSAALRRNGWDDDQPVWTGSCPCQPFSGRTESRRTCNGPALPLDSGAFATGETPAAPTFRKITRGRGGGSFAILRRRAVERVPQGFRRVDADPYGGGGAYVPTQPGRKRRWPRPLRRNSSARSK